MSNKIVAMIVFLGLIMAMSIVGVAGLNLRKLYTTEATVMKNQMLETKLKDILIDLELKKIDSLEAIDLQLEAISQYIDEIV